ncbi:MAG: hypothetical protein J6X18_07320 [Bacteroidales bacterium]|nr:hypothetical protein [Bacteroidales bacterium]
MRVTRENLECIKYYAGSKRSIDSYAELLLSLLDELGDINRDRYNKVYIEYIGEHTSYNPERTDPCPDYYGCFLLRWEDEPFETVGTEMTLEELDIVLCALSDFLEHNR